MRGVLEITLSDVIVGDPMHQLMKHDPVRCSRELHLGGNLGTC